MKKFISGFLVAYAFWIFFTWSFAVDELLVGAIVAFIAAIVSYHYYDFDLLTIDLPIRIIKFIFLYLPILIWEMLKANLTLAMIVLNPKLPIDADVVVGSTDLQGDMSRLVLANSITLTPGTLTLDVEDGKYYIHAVEVSKVKDERSITGVFEKVIRGVFE